MKHTKLFTNLLMFSLLLFCPASVLAQKDPASAMQHYAPVRSTVSVAGDSTIHEWTMVGKDIEGKVLIPGPIESSEDLMALVGKGVVVEALFPVKTLKSGKSGMDENAYDALKESKNPLIRFTLDKLLDAKQKDPEKLSVTVNATGNLTVAGVSKQIELSVAVSKPEEGVLVVSGSKKLDMTNFNVKPPRAMLGLIKTDKDVEVSFTWRLKHQGVAASAAEDAEADARN